VGVEEQFSEEFERAFNFTMKQEIGSWYDPNDPEVIAGLCETKSQKRKTGYVNHPADPGGETKFGIAANANPEVNIKKMTLHEARVIYFKKYWLPAKCDKFQSPLAEVHFDAAVNHGVGRAAKMLQESLDVSIDGVIGPNTLAVINSNNPFDLARKQNKIRKRFFKSIVERKPSQAVFLEGWLARVERVEQFIA
jgi:lysozyme family protein